MPPPLAALLFIGFIIFLFFRDSRNQADVSGARWVPVMWLAITGSRFVSQWISLGSFGGGSAQMHGGSPIDALYFLILILVGAGILVSRRVSMSEILRNNIWISIFFIYCLFAILWSDFPFIAFKRYIKILGHPIMALIILTDPDPVNAMRSVFKRCAYILMPLSILFIKYFPEYGRGFNPWTGEAYNNGIMLNKNELGYSCMIFGIFFYWNLLMTRRIPETRARLEETLLSIGFLYMIGWLLYKAHSSTSLATFIIGIATMIVLGLPVVSKRFIGTYVVVFILIAGGAELGFGVYARVVELLGRDATLTDRTLLWADCLALVENPVIGAGFESFWLGSRLDKLWAIWSWQPNQAHSGYIEMYLNLGAVGVFLMFGLIVSTFRKVSVDLLKHPQFARLRLSYLFAIVFYNYTEATFKGVHLVWTIFFIVAIDYPQLRRTATKKLARSATRRRSTTSAKRPASA